MCVKCWTCCCLLALAFLATGLSDSEETPAGMTGDEFAAALAERLELDWNPCPDTLGERTRNLDDLRCAVIGEGDPRVAAESLALFQASLGGKVLDVEYGDRRNNHLYAREFTIRISADGEILTPSDGAFRMPSFDRLDYLIGKQRVSMWIQRIATPLVEGGEPERWIAIRVSLLEEPFPDYMPASPPRR
jgi:hypothetical protein